MSIAPALLRLQNGAQLVGVRGATKLVFTGGASMFQSEGASTIGLTGLTLDGGGIPLPTRRGLVHCLGGRDVRIADCEITGSGGNGIWFEQVSGDVSGNIFTNIAATAMVSFDAQGPARVAQHHSRHQRQRHRNPAHRDRRRRHAGADNRIEDIKAGPGGSGQYGNAINAFRAGNVIVRGNRIQNCDYSAVRGNSASNIQITGNSVSDVREVALYSEFSFEGAVIANNTVDGAALGVSVCNFNEGGRIAVVQGNIIRNLLPKRPIGTAPDDDAGVGIYVEADTSVTGNVIENAPSFGIVAGWGKYLRDVVISGNVIRKAFVGIGVSVVPGAGTALVNNNMISETPRGAVVGLDHARPECRDDFRRSHEVGDQHLVHAADRLEHVQVVLARLQLEVARLACEPRAQRMHALAARLRAAASRDPGPASRPAGRDAACAIRARWRGRAARVRGRWARRDRVRFLVFAFRARRSGRRCEPAIEEVGDQRIALGGKAAERIVAAACNRHELGAGQVRDGLRARMGLNTVIVAVDDQQGAADLAIHRLADIECGGIVRASTVLASTAPVVSAAQRDAILDLLGRVRLGEDVANEVVGEIRIVVCQ